MNFKLKLEKFRLFYVRSFDSNIIGFLIRILKKNTSTQKSFSKIPGRIIKKNRIYFSFLII